MIGGKHVDVWPLAPTKPVTCLSRNQRGPKMACEARVYSRGPCPLSLRAW